MHRFFVILSLILISFGCNYERNVEYNVQFELLDSIIRSLEDELLPLEEEIKNLAAFSSQLYANKDSLILAAEKDRYIASKNNWFYNPNLNNKESTVFVSLRSLNTDASVEEVYLTEPMDGEFIRIVDKFPMVTQVYYNSSSQVSRLFPPYDWINTIDPDIDVTSFNFYYLGNEINNPDKDHVWVDEIYVDPAGRGWIMSIIHPVYYESELKGVLGMDITLTDLMRYFLSKFNESLVIVDKQGTIVAGSNNAIESLNMPPLKNHTYVQTIVEDNFRKEDFNLFKSKSREVRQMASKLLLENESIFEFSLDGHNYKVYFRKMNLINWYFLYLQN
jgi:hypothetical protein